MSMLPWILEYLAPHAVSLWLSLPSTSTQLFTRWLLGATWPKGQAAPAARLENCGCNFYLI
eukprot:2225346-Amphidinium_carterae.1